MTGCWNREHRHVTKEDMQLFRLFVLVVFAWDVLSAAAVYVLFIHLWLESAHTAAAEGILPLVYPDAMCAYCLPHNNCMSTCLQNLLHHSFSTIMHTWCIPILALGRHSMVFGQVRTSTTTTIIIIVCCDLHQSECTRVGFNQASCTCAHTTGGVRRAS